MKAALITGGSRGIGKAICIQLAKEEQYHILINYNRNEEAAKSTLKEVEKQGGQGEIIKFNVADAEQVQQQMDHWSKSNPKAIVEVLVNNAGITDDGLFMWMNENQWKNVINTSLDGFYNTTRYVIQKMLRNRYGRIVNVSSVSGVKGTAGQVNYSAAKGALVAATKALAQEVAKRKITVNAVAPGFISSDMTAELDEKELSKIVPIGRFGSPEEVAHLVSFLCSQKASYITGEVININGGIYS